MSAAPSLPPSVLVARRCLPTLLLAMIALGTAGTALAGQTAAGSGAPVDPRIANVLSELEKTRTIYQTALSPDGQWIAWVVGADEGTEIQVAPMADPAHPRRLTAGTGAPCTEQSLAWSFGDDLAFTSDCNAAAGAAAQADVYIAAPAA